MHQWNESTPSSFWSLEIDLYMSRLVTRVWMFGALSLHPLAPTATRLRPSLSPPPPPTRGVQIGLSRRMLFDHVPDFVYDTLMPLRAEAVTTTQPRPAPADTVLTLSFSDDASRDDAALISTA